MICGSVVLNINCVNNVREAYKRVPSRALASTRLGNFDRPLRALAFYGATNWVGIQRKHARSDCPLINAGQHELDMRKCVSSQASLRMISKTAVASEVRKVRQWDFSDVLFPITFPGALVYPFTVDADFPASLHQGK